MNNSDYFIGLGNNPGGIDLPTGLGMQLAQSPQAYETFGHMSGEQKAQLVSYIKGATTGADAKNRIMSAVDHLAHGQMEGF